MAGIVRRKYYMLRGWYFAQLPQPLSRLHNVLLAPFRQTAVFQRSTWDEHNMPEVWP